MQDRHIVIAGQGRSGSTLFYNMMRHCLSGDFHLPPSEVPARSLINRPGHVCTKRPFDIFDMSQIAEAARGRKRLDLIVTLRDPRDILTSRHKSVPHDYFTGADFCYLVPENGPPSFTAPGLLRVHDQIRQILASGLFPQGVFLLKYEHLIADPNRIQSLLAQGLELSFDGAFEDFHKAEIPEDLQRALNGVRAVDAARVAKWRKPQHRARILDQFTRFPQLHEVLEELGYEDNRDWFAALIAEAAQQEAEIRPARRAGRAG